MSAAVIRLRLCLCLAINTRFGTPSLDLGFPSSTRYKSSSCFCSTSLCAALMPTFQFSALPYPPGSVPLWSISVSSFQMNLPFSKFRFYLCALLKAPVPVWRKIYFTLPSLTSMGLMVLSSTCSSVVLIEAHWLHESSPKICSLFLTVRGYPARPVPARMMPLTIPVLSLAGAGSPAALILAAL